MQKIAAMILLFIFANVIHADPVPRKTYKHPNSECIVESTAGEYPHYRVIKNNKIIYEPETDGIIKVAFSPDGSFIAFSGSETNWVDIVPGKYEYSVVVMKCSSGKLKGFTSGYPEPDLSWNGNDAFSYTDSASGKKIEIKL